MIRKLTIPSIRRIHLYLALFLMPWIIMYALSGLAMHHREWVAKLYDGTQNEFAPERTLDYDAVFPEDAPIWVMAEQILADIDLEGRFNARENHADNSITINRHDPVTPRRIIYSPADRTLTILRNRPLSIPILIRIHHRLGYGNGSFWDNAWAVSVDAVILAIFFWAISGIIMWRNIKVTRRKGFVFLIVGIVIFLTCVVIL